MAKPNLLTANDLPKALSQTSLGLFRLCAVGVILFSLLACSENIPHTQQQKLMGSTMGTPYSIVFYYPEKGDQLFTKSSTVQIKKDIELRLEQIEQSMSTYRADSELSLLNKADVGEWLDISAELFTVIAAAQQVSMLSNGAFDISVGPLVNIWGFGPDFSAQHIPNQEIIDALLKDKVGYQYLEIDQQQRRVKKHKPLYLDLSAIAKGYAVDQAALVLEQNNIQNYLVEIGGELRASGQKPNEQSWRVAVEKPIFDTLGKERAVEHILKLENIAIATSGDYRNFFESNGQIYSHTIDPSTGWPIKHELASVTVLHQSCMQADALATAFNVMGLDATMRFANEHQLAVLLLIHKEQGFEQYTSEAMRAFVSDAKDL